MSDLRTQLQNTLGNAYTLERELGGGGMSRVFVAEETAYGRRVVVKVLPPEIAADVSGERFRREIQVAARLMHPHVVPVLTSGETNGLPYYTMPFVEGESLRARLRTGPLPVTEAVGVLSDVAKALQYAHEHGVVHRDIKPDNILLSSGSASVTDFGIAKAISAARDAQAGHTLTQIGTSLGTPAYMAPEQAAADPASDHRADIYSFGCVAFEVLAGRPPFVASSPQRLLAAQMGEKPQAILELRPDTPTELADLVMRCLQKEAEARPQSAAEVVRVLETVTSGGGHAAVPSILAGGPGMLRKALLSYALAFVALMIVARAAVIALGLPDWVMTGAVVVMLLGLPVILFTAWVQRVTRRAITQTPTYTPGGTQSTGRKGTVASLALKASPHMSWKRTARGGMYAMGGFALVVVTFMALRAAGVGPFASLLSSGRLSQTDALLLTDFRVVNTDTTLGPVISEAVRSNIGQSRVVHVLPRTRVSEALQRMRRSPGDRVDLALAQQLAAREGIKSIVDGEIAALGTGYLVKLRLVTADSARELASFWKAAAGPAELIEVVDDLSRKLRAEIGESLRDVRASTPLAQATTASIDALRKLTESRQATGRGDFPKAVTLLQQAIAIDTSFVMAYRELAEALLNAGRGRAAIDSVLNRAYAMRDRLPERERLIVTAEYLQRNGDRGGAIDNYRRAFELGDRTNTNSLGNLYAARREHAVAESLGRIRIQVDPSHTMSYSNLAMYQIAQGKLAAADSTLVAARARGLDYYQLFTHRLRIAFIRDSLDRMDAIADSVHRVARGQQLSTAKRSMANSRFLRGQPRAGERLLAEAGRVDSARGAVRPWAPDTIDAVMRSLWYYGPSPQLVRRLDALSFPQESRLALAAAYSRLGQPEKGRALIQRSRAARDSVVENEDGDLGAAETSPQLHLALAEAAFAEGKYAEAIAAFQKADSLPDGPAFACVSCLWRNLARVYDAAGNADSAIATMTRALQQQAHGEIAALHMFMAPFEKRLGELYEGKGDRQRAYAHYARFVSLWKNAEPELQPTVADVRRRIARLSDVERR